MTVALDENADNSNSGEKTRGFSVEGIRILYSHSIKADTYTVRALSIHNSILLANIKVWTNH